MALIFYVRSSSDSTTTRTLSASSTLVLEGQSVDITLTTTGLPAGLIIPYEITGSNITLGDFVGRTSLKGNFVLDEQGLSTVTLTLAQDLVVETTETFTVSLVGRSSINVSVNISDVYPGAAWDNGTSTWDNSTTYWDIA